MVKDNTNKFKQDRIYESVENFFADHAIPFIILFMVSMVVFILFWAQCSSSGDTCTRLTNINFLMLYIIPFIIVLELIYVWICKNQKVLKDDDVIVYKIVAFCITSVVINIFIPLLYGVYYLIAECLIDVLIAICGIAIIAAVLYGFYMANKYILVAIRESRKIR